MVNMRKRFGRTKTLAFPALASLLIALAASAGCHSLNVGTELRPPATYKIDPWSYHEVEGRIVTTPHYEIRTTLRDINLLRVLPNLMEDALAHYQKLVPPTHEPEGRMQVYLFAAREDFARFTRETGGAKAPEFLKLRFGGYSEQGVTVIQYGAHHVTYPLMCHEGFHQYLHHYVDGGVPPWLNEGLAVCCEGIRWNGDRVEKFDRWWNPLRRNRLAEALLRDRLYSLPELLDMHAGVAVDDGAESTATYYAQVWALVLYLQSGGGGRYADGYRRMIADLGSGDLRQYARAEGIWSEGGEVSVGRALFRRFITDDESGFEEGYRRFLRRTFLDER